MKSKLSIVFSASVLLLTLAGPTLAHHGTAVYDLEHPVTLEGTITNIEWSNPHILIFFDVKDDKGNITNWTCELGSPNKARRDHGWTANTFAVGEHVSIVGAPRKDGRSAVWLEHDQIKESPKD